VAKIKSLSPTGLRTQNYKPVENQYIDYSLLVPLGLSSTITNYRKPAAGITKQQITHQSHNMSFVRGISASKATFSYLQEIKRPKNK
jgi:hypothetical protein